MVKLEDLPENHQRLWADLFKRHAKLEELLGKKLPPLPGLDDPPEPTEQIIADLARREELLLKMLKEQKQHLKKHDILLAKQDEKRIQ